MADTLQIPNTEKFGKEQLLLGDITVTVTGCNGQAFDIHGLTANDLVMKTLQGQVMTLHDFIMDYAGTTPDVTNSSVTSSSGNTVTLKEVVDTLESLNFDEVDAQSLYNQSA
jgi:hypothetical protein